MAIRFSHCSAFILPLSHDSKKGFMKNQMVMCAKNDISADHQIRLPDLHKNKIYEDRSAGIVCYKDKNGEITCEGCDEGPRFHPQISGSSCSSRRDVEIIDLLQRCWLLHVTDENRV
ncbi:hypothetical protein OROGR_028833 [Orobanche gracilis]